MNEAVRVIACLWLKEEQEMKKLATVCTGPPHASLVNISDIHNHPLVNAST